MSSPPPPPNPMLRSIIEKTLRRHTCLRALLRYKLPATSKVWHQVVGMFEQGRQRHT